MTRRKNAGRYSQDRSASGTGLGMATLAGTIAECQKFAPDFKIITEVVDSTTCVGARCTIDGKPFELLVAAPGHAQPSESVKLGIAETCLRDLQRRAASRLRGVAR